MSQSKDPIRVDRKISIGVLVALAFQTAGVLIWSGAASERLKQLEDRMQANADNTERLARLEEHATYTRVALDRIERRLDESQ